MRAGVRGDEAADGRVRACAHALSVHHAVMRDNEGVEGVEGGGGVKRGRWRHESIEPATPESK